MFFLIFFLNNTYGGGFMSFHYRHRKIIIICILSLAFIISSFFFYYKNFYNKKHKVKIVESKKEIKKDKIIIKNDDGSKNHILKVDIKGQIVSPGIYEFEEGNRVIDVINKAGGLTEEADTTVINLSKKIKDEMVIIVYSKEEVSDFKKTKEMEKVVIDKCVQKDNESIINDACIDSDKNSNNGSLLININTSSLDELKTLPGIGESKAKNIIEYRDLKGLFNSIEELKNVDGIGEGLYDQVKDFITV